MGEVRIQDAFRLAEDGSGLTRVMRLRGSASPGLYLRLAEAERIERLSDGSWAIGDCTYYLEGSRTARPVIRRVGGREELILPLRFEDGAAEVQYSIIW